MRVFIALCSAFVVGFVVGQTSPDTANAETEAAKPGYMVVMGKNYNREDLMPYSQSLPPIYAKYQGAYVAFAAKVETFEGAYPYQSMIISKWPSIENARQFWNSPEYAEARKLREGVGEFDVIAFEGLAAQQ